MATGKLVPLSVMKEVYEIAHQDEIPVYFNEIEDGVFRFMTCNDISKKDIDHVVDVLTKMLA
ncbi:MAG: hypothetical protein RR263_02125 [Oscillospiraceae bacterium]